MITRRTALGLMAAALAPGVLRAAAGASRSSSARNLQAGELPPLAERLPKRPRVVDARGDGRVAGPAMAATCAS